jgi:hypothetical protein
MNIAGTLTNAAKANAARRIILDQTMLAARPLSNSAAPPAPVILRYCVGFRQALLTEASAPKGFLGESEDTWLEGHGGSEKTGEVETEYEQNQPENDNKT